MNLKGKTAVVTGATAGIGREIAEGLATSGATVVLACRNLEAAEQVASDIRARCRGADVVVGPRLDLASQESVSAFAAAYAAAGRPLHLLVNNAGANYLPRSFTPEGVGMLAQVNYLGPYTLTRLLERQLAASAPARVVNLSSVMQRTARLEDPSAFLHCWDAGEYAATKLANVLFAYEAQRRLGPAGIESCAIDPGGVASSIWRNSAFSRPPLSWVVGGLYSPPSDGASSALHACRLPLGAPPAARGFRRGSVAAAHPQFKFFARGLFASDWVTGFGGRSARDGGAERLRFIAWGVGTAVLSLLDWPLRGLTRGRYLSATYQVPSVPSSYDQQLASDLWDVSAKLAGLPPQPT